jgi:hypothetical protein
LLSQVLFFEDMPEQEKWMERTAAQRTEVDNQPISFVAARTWRVDLDGVADWNL